MHCAPCGTACTLRCAALGSSGCKSEHCWQLMMAQSLSTHRSPTPGWAASRPRDRPKYEKIMVARFPIPLNLVPFCRRRKKIRGITSSQKVSPLAMAQPWVQDLPPKHSPGLRKLLSSSMCMQCLFKTCCCCCKKGV